jgi:hypothetical protein
LACTTLLEFVKIDKEWRAQEKKSQCLDLADEAGGGNGIDYQAKESRARYVSWNSQGRNVVHIMSLAAK